MKMPSREAVGLLVAFSILVFAGVFYIQFQKAAVYECTYGAYDGNAIGIQPNHAGGQDNLRCYDALPNETAPVCSPGYNNPPIKKGDFYLTENELNKINSDSIANAH
jgi:hypothetical protein